ncbi:myophilin [Acrasis kona]|uniref:Myophilin n=1 Tax=Acrasis kona TaxID=1008807 RepID=A0AAW2YM95_9EUKA
MSNYLNYSSAQKDKDGIPIYGMDKELQDKKNAKYNPESEREVREWIETLTGEKFKGGFQESLKSGVLLCNFVNKIRPGIVPKINKSNLPFMQMENIGYFLKAATDLGLKTHDTFQTVDLYEDKNIPKVIQSLLILGSVVQKDPSYRGPKVGVKLADKTEYNFTEQQLRESQNTVGRQYDASINHGNVTSIGREVVKTKDTGLRTGQSQQTGGSLAPERNASIGNEIIKTTSVGDTRVNSQQTSGSLKGQTQSSIGNEIIKTSSVGDTRVNSQQMAGSLKGLQNPSISNSIIKTSPRGGSEDKYAELEKLAGLRDKGILTEGEFQAKKKQILGL